MDKAHVKQRVQAWLPQLDVVPTLNVVRDASAINASFIDRLPTEYVVKAAHGSGMVVLVRGETARNVNCGQKSWHATLRTSDCHSLRRSDHARFVGGWCRRWLRVDYGRLHGEAQYSRVPRSCVFEASLMDARGIAPRDLKVFVLHGTPFFLMDVASRYGVGKRKSATSHVLVDVEGHALAGAYGAGRPSLADYRANCADRAGERATSLVPEYAAGQVEQLLGYSRVLI
jgi:hypothetical protein